MLLDFRRFILFLTAETETTAYSSCTHALHACSLLLSIFILPTPMTLTMDEDTVLSKQVAFSERVTFDNGPDPFRAKGSGSCFFFF